MSIINKQHTKEVNRFLRNIKDDINQLNLDKVELKIILMNEIKINLDRYNSFTNKFNFLYNDVFLPIFLPNIYNHYNSNKLH